MSPIIRNILAVIAGVLIGGFANISLVNVGYSVFPLEGVDTNDLEALGAALSTAGIEHFVFPFLAHALGTLIGAFVAAWIAAPNNKMTVALIVGVFYLIGGIAASSMIPAPTWFSVVDLVVAYIPMGYLGGVIGKKVSKNQASNEDVLDNLS